MLEKFKKSLITSILPRWTFLQPGAAVILVSALTLFLELAFIRFLPAHILYFGFFSNFVLLAAFLGIGVGFLLGKNKVLLITYLPVLLFILVLGTNLFSTGINLVNNEVIFFNTDADLPAHVYSPYIILPVMFFLIAVIFSTLGQYLSKFFSQSKRPLQVYIFDILGSIIGIASFFLLSFLGLPPVIWFSFIAVALACLIPKNWVITGVFFICMIGVLFFSIDRGKGQFFWSPYQRVTYIPVPETGGGNILTNNISHQFFTSYENAPMYQMIFSRLSAMRRLEDLLIIGSGTGLDLNAALHANTDHIDAVEIDPQILSIGKDLHPDQPYSDSRVTIYNTDGRNFLHASPDKYDVIIFALTDSLVLNSGFNQVRLESYLFTTDAFREVRNHLKPGGLFVMYNNYRTDWLIDRLGTMMQTEFGSRPTVISLGNKSRMFIARNNSDLALTPPTTVSRNLPSDDWPFPYLKSRSFPPYYLFTSFAILIFSAFIVSLVLKLNARETKMNISRMGVFFLLGAAFSLIEAKSFAQLDLLFGSTWMVNGVAFSGILIVVLLATLFTTRFTTIRMVPVYVLFFISLVVQFLIPIEWFLQIPFEVRLIAAILYFFLPIFFANLIFARIFKESSSSDLDFGSNILGLVFGGVTEYIALVTGYKALVIIAGVFYLTAVLLLKRTKKRIA